MPLFFAMKTYGAVENELAGDVDPLVGVNSKTSWYPAAGRSWSGGRWRILGPKVLEANYYHVMSRTCGGEIFFDEVEKEALKRVLWRVAAFCGVEVLTYCIMGNHFHVLVSVPHRETWLQRFEGTEGERRLLGHLRTLYSKSYIEQLQMEIQEWRRLGQEVLVQKKLESFKRRMGDLSRFVKEVKERFSRWYNKRHERKGTLWMDRFKSVLIEGNVGRRGEREADRVDVVRVMAAYIDLNPVRAELASNSKDYPFCGYGEACAGEKRAQRGLCRVVGRAVDGWDAQGVEKVYAGLLSGVDWETGKRRKRKRLGGEAERSPAGESGEGESLSLADLLRQRVRAFSDSLVLGSQGFVEEVFQANRSCFGPKRKEGARRMPQSAAELYVARRVRDESTSVS
jgi:REP element-mobilizing transposase RayT